MDSHNFDILVIGAGPAGLMAALAAADACGPEVRICILEKKQKPGCKLLLAGSGRCNLTHAGGVEDFLSRYGGRARFVKPSLYGFSPKGLKDFFETRGVPLKELHEGKIFPVSEKSAEVLGLLLSEAGRLGVKIISGDSVTGILRGGELEGFSCSTESGTVFSSAAVILATGGRSYPATGSSGGGYSLAESLGHRIAEPRPALTSLEIPDSPFLVLPGIALHAGLMIPLEKGKSVRAEGDLLFTHKGFSGPLILNSSRFLSAGRRIELNFAGMDGETLRAALVDPSTAAGGKLIRTAVQSLLGPGVPGRLVSRVLELSEIPGDKKLAETGKKTLKKLVQLMTACPFTIGRLGGWGEAMVTAGGVALSEVNPKTLESRIVPGLYFAGEVVDVDGDEGGFNLQWAFSSGHMAGRSAAGMLTSPPP